MVLKNDDHTGDFCQAIDASEDSCSNVLVSEWKEKGLGRDNDDSSMNRRANDKKEFFGSGMDKDDRSGSCQAGLVNSLGQSVEAVDLRTNPRSPRLDHDTEDSLLEYRKGSQSSEATVQRLSVSPRDKCHSQSEKAVQSNQVMESDEKCESSLQTSLDEEVDESDVEEEDVSSII